ncbi:MAG TPA: glycoside hydrolase family 130 protein [Flavitalea sp.]|nr:glycoside hydrolase family 130 protein [Flavitalea sp.]
MRLYIFLACTCLSMICCSENKTDSTKKIDEGWELVAFKKVDSLNPILSAGKNTFDCPLLKRSIAWEQKDVFNPAVVVRDGKIFMLYRAEDTVGKYAGVSRIGLAESTDGFQFTRHPHPVLYPDEDAQKVFEWEGGCEDPRVVEDSNGTYYMTYTAYDGNLARMLIASSKDLLHWTKHGSVFSKAFNGKYVNKWSKSGSIVSRYDTNGKIIAEKINGKYWMYWGDVNIWAATSDDLINWTPVLYEGGAKATIPLRRNAGEIAEVRIVFGPRNGKFDSDLVESGPPAMITEKGILLLYNSRNIPSIGDKALAEGTYAAGQILMDKNDPLNVIARSDNYFIHPDQPYETTGQVNHVCFVEGLARFQNKWFLYYGTADSKIAVAVKEQ